MNFEKALEAMKQGNSVIHKGNKLHYILSVFRDYIVGIGNDYRIEDVVFRSSWEDVAFRSSWLLNDGWEIYEEFLKESQKEPEMTAEKAIAFLQTVCGSIKIAKKNNVAHVLYDGFDEAIDCINFAIKAIGNQNQPEPEKKSKCGLNCKIQPAKVFYDDEGIHKLAFDTFTAGLKFGLEIAKDLQKENKNNAG